MQAQLNSHALIVLAIHGASKADHGVVQASLFISAGIVDGMGKQDRKKPVVLVVEDEAVIRMNIVQVAEDAGYEVLEAANADEAIDILECRNDICAVFTDVRMPGYMDGIRLARAIRGRWPPIQLIIMSGMELPEDLDFPLTVGLSENPIETNRSPRRCEKFKAVNSDLQWQFVAGAACDRKAPRPFTCADNPALRPPRCGSDA